MTDKEYNYERNRIRKLISRWRDRLGLGWWRIDFEYEREEPEFTGSTDYAPLDIDGIWRNVAVTRCDPNYLKATIVFYIVQIRKLDDEELETVFVHECMHVILSPMHTKQTAKSEELVATKLAQSFIYTFNSLKTT